MQRLASIGLIAISLIAMPAFAETKTYDFRTFTKLDIAAGYEVIFTQGSQRAVSIESDDFSKVEVSQRGDTLKISRPDNTRMNRKHNTDIVRITAPDLKSAELNAGVKFSSDNLSVGDIDLDINAGVEARFRNMKARNVKLDAAAGVKIDMDGTCETLEVEASAGVEIDARDLKCREARVEAEVGSSVRVNASERARADAGLGASVRIAGSPKSVDKQTSMGGSIRID